MTTETNGGTAAPGQPPGIPGQGLMTRAGRAGTSLGAKFFILGLLAVLLCIPLLSVWALVSEREQTYRMVTTEIGNQWGGQQFLSGPFLAVPVVVRVPRVGNDRNQGPELVRNYMLLAPDTLQIDGDIASEERQRGIYEAIVYRADVTLDAAFAAPAERDLPPDLARIDWDDARMVVSLTDMKGVESASVTANQRDAGRPLPGLGLGSSGNRQGFHVPVDLSDWQSESSGPGPRAFSIALEFRGSQRLSLAPVGADSTATLRSEWPHPSFEGAFLPGTRTVEESGFSAAWSIPELARSIPRVSLMSLDRQGFSASNVFNAPSFGVRLFQPVDHYRYVDRATKYGVLFIGVAFLVIFAIEVLSRGRMHMVHYAMTGLMVVMFYVLLLALSEIVGFQMAYAIAAGATGGVIAAFTASVFSGRIWALSAFGGFAGLYSLLYVVLSLEDVALLTGAIAGFVTLAVLMFATRKVDWGETKQTKAA